MVLPVRELRFFFIIYAPSLSTVERWHNDVETLLSARMIASVVDEQFFFLFDSIVSLIHFDAFQSFVSSYASFCWQLKHFFITNRNRIE